MADSVKWKRVHVCTKRLKCHQEIIRLEGTVLNALPWCSLPSSAVKHYNVLSPLHFATFADPLTSSNALKSLECIFQIEINKQKQVYERFQEGASFFFLKIPERLLFVFLICSSGVLRIQDGNQVNMTPNLIGKGHIQGHASKARWRPSCAWVILLYLPHQ